MGWDPLVDATRRLKQQSIEDKFDLLVTGHSMGGAFAVVAGAAVGVPVLGVSSPGHLYNMKRFNVTEKAIKQSSVVIQPDKDFWPALDQQVGFTQFIECKYDTKFCHEALATACELFRTCGDPRDRQNFCSWE